MELNDKRLEVVKLRDEAAKEKSSLEDKVTLAKAESDAIGTQRGFEGYVRSTYPVVKEGEGVIVIYDEGKNPVSEVRSTMNVWERLLVWIQGFLK
jgi:hypothetical protein